MDWSDEDVEQAWASWRAKSEPHVPEKALGDAMRRVMTRAVELKSALWLTLNHHWLTIAGHSLLRGSLSRDDQSRLYTSLIAQGARVAVLEAARDALEEEVHRLSGLAAVAEVVAAWRERDAALADAEAFRAQTDKAKQSEAVWRKRLEAAAEELADVGAGECGRLDIVTRVRMLKAQLAALSVDMAKVVGEPTTTDCPSTEACAVCGTASGFPCNPRVRRHLRECGDPSRCALVTRYPCSPTCTHDDAATPGHAERVKERSELIKVSNDSHAAGAEAMRAACLEAAMEVWESSKGVVSRNALKDAIEGAAP